MTTISSISELLSLSESQYRIYDVGRKINKISKEQFSKIELNHQPYPFPINSNACIAIIFWQKNSSQPYIWFVKLPLDERGLLNQGARNHYIAIIIEALGKDITDAPSEQQEELLKNNPYHFTPAEYKMAAFNSIINVELKRPMSSHYNLFVEYMEGVLGWDNWQEIGVQGINDFAANIKEPELSKRLTTHLSYIPEQVLTPLCIALENQELPNNVIEGVLQLLSSENLIKHEELSLSLLRALSSSSQAQKVQHYITKLLQNERISVNTLIVISGRFWELFSDKTLALCFFEKIAQQNDLPLFSEIFKDLVSIPSIRTNVLSIIRSTERSEALSIAIGHIFNNTNKAS